MKNLSLEGLTPEQIKLLESVADGFRVKKEEEKVELVKSNPTKFYRLISYSMGGDFNDNWGADLNFIAKINSDDLNIEVVVRYGYLIDELMEGFKKESRSPDFDILKFVEKWDDIMDDGCGEWTTFLEIDEISEDEYNDSDSWKNGSIKCKLKIEIVSSSFTKIIIDEESDEDYYDGDDDED